MRIRIRRRNLFLASFIPFAIFTAVAVASSYLKPSAYSCFLPNNDWVELSISPMRASFLRLKCSGIQVPGSPDPYFKIFINGFETARNNVRQKHRRVPSASRVASSMPSFITGSGVDVWLGWPPAISLFFPIGFVLLRARRNARRRALNICVNCTYNLEGNVSGVCPECGTAISARLPDISVKVRTNS